MPASSAWPVAEMSSSDEPVPFHGGGFPALGTARPGSRVGCLRSDPRRTPTDRSRVGGAGAAGARRGLCRRPGRGQGDGACTTQEVYEQYRREGDINKVIEGARNIVKWKKELKSKKPFVF